MQAGIGVGMYVEVEAYVGAVVACIEQRDGVLVVGGVVMGEQTVAVSAAPCYDVAWAYGIGWWCIIGEVCACEWQCIGCYHEFVALAVYAYVAVDGGSAAEGLFVAQCWYVVGKEARCACP